MGIFTRGSRHDDYPRHSTGTGNTLNEPGYYDNNTNHGMSGTHHGVPGTHHGVGGTTHGMHNTNTGMHNSHTGMHGPTHGLDGTSHGIGGTNHGVGGTTHGIGGTNHGVGGTTHGIGGTNHGVGGTTHGIGGTNHGVGGTTHGMHNNNHNMTGSTHGLNGNTHGIGDNNHGYGRRNRLGRSRFGGRSRGHSEKGHREKRPLFDRHSGVYNRRPSFGQWLKYTWLDILTMIIMGAIGLGVYEADPAPSRSFPVTFANGQIVYPQFAYPLRNEIIPIWAAALLAALVPIVVFLFMQIRIRSFWDVNNAVIGLLYSLIGAAVFQVFVKWLIGGLRPHFLDVCQPDLTRVAGGGEGFGGLMWKSDICTGDRKQINDSLESMPSGHSTAAWAGFLYLYFYLNAKLKVFSNHHPAMWKLIALYAPLLGASLITGALTIDEFHNWYDCLAGAIIGSVFAISAYRMVYASVWDFRFNHIPLTRHTPFSYGAGSAGAGGFETCVFTHKAGWGYEEAYGGAPFDSAFALRGMGGGMGGMSGSMSGGGHTVGLGHKNTSHRDGDLEHNAALGSTGTGLGHHSTHDRHSHGLSTGVGHNTTTGTHGTSGIGHSTSTGHNHGTGLLGRHNDHHDNYNNTTSSITHPTGAHHDGHFTNRDHVTDPDYDREGRSTIVGDDNNRYRSHRKSLERKQVPRNEAAF